MTHRFTTYSTDGTKYKTTLLLHTDCIMVQWRENIKQHFFYTLTPLPRRTSTGHHSLLPSSMPQTNMRFWPTGFFRVSSLASLLACIPFKLLSVYFKQNGEKFSDLGNWSLSRHTSALTECTDWTAVFKFRRSSRSLDQLMKTAN